MKIESDKVNILGGVRGKNIRGPVSIEVKIEITKIGLNIWHLWMMSTLKQEK